MSLKRSIVEGIVDMEVREELKKIKYILQGLEMGSGCYYCGKLSYGEPFLVVKSKKSNRAHCMNCAMTSPSFEYD